MTKYTKSFPGRSASISDQTRPEQVQASDGGFVFQADQWDRLDRFLILGTVGGSYYASERSLTRDNVLEVIIPAIVSEGIRVVDRVREISTQGRAIKNDEALFVLALCSSMGSKETQRHAFDVLPEVARTGTHLFQFISYATEYRGWGSAFKKGVANWYTSKTPRQLAYQMLKYRQRHGYTHADVLNLAHPTPPNAQADLLFAHAIAEQYSEAQELQARYQNLKASSFESVPRHLQGFELAREAARLGAPASEMARLIEDYGLVREMVPTEYLNKPEVWEAFLGSGMPMTAMIRNLGNMSQAGLLRPMSDSEAVVLEALGSEEAIKGARVHPFQVLTALLTYSSGRGFRGSGQWDVSPAITDALDQAFYLAFQNVEPTGKRIMLAFDVSGSMGYPDLGGIPGLNPRVASAALGLVTAATEQSFYSVAFTQKLVQFPLSARQRLDDVCAKMSRMDFGYTRVPAPMEYATRRKLEVDAFVVYTDSETNVGGHPYQALRDYRAKMGILAKLVVVGMASNGFTVADPDDPGMLDVVGFDTATPRVISEFIRQ